MKRSIAQRLRPGDGRGRMITALSYPLFTTRLRLEPVTPALAAAARAGQAVFADTIGADAPADWCAASLGLVARSGASDGPTRVIAVHRAEGCVIGDVRFEPSPRAVREFEIGYGVARARRRQGYAVEATGRVIDWLFSSGGADSIIAGCDSRNLASVRTLRRLGFWLDSNPGKTFWWLLTADLRSSA
ncbi:MAG: GNAT family N-acetyltransferase [Hyphomonadaceae bacterium]|nr:GNAT family N-acetyltransferase [Hyphomonadaceae bacterium]